MAVLTAASALGVLPLAWGLRALDAGAVALGIALVAGAKLWFVDRGVWAAEDMRRAPDGPIVRPETASPQSHIRPR